MIFWSPLPMLMADALQVIEMRTRLVALGRGTSDEMFLMVTEKIEAFDDARAILIRGGDPAHVLNNYRSRGKYRSVVRLGRIGEPDRVVSRPGHLTAMVIRKDLAFILT